MDFSFPLTSSFLRLFYAKEGEGANWMVYFKSFQPDSWWGLLATATIGFFIMVVLIEKIHWTKRDFSISMAFCFTVLAQVNHLISMKKLSRFHEYFFQLGRRFPIEPRRQSLRAAFFSLSATGFILISLYR